jgi:CheY-like chemotaxis protein
MAQVLVIDDSEDITELYVLVLEGAGYQVSTAADGEEGLALIAARRPDVVVLDIMMPGIDGLTFLARLPGVCAAPLPPVIASSGFDECREEALRRGACAFLRKPVSVEVLLRAVESALASHTVETTVIARNDAEAEDARDRATEVCAELVAHIDGALSEPVRRRLRALARWLCAWHGYGTSFIHIRHGDLLYLEATFNGPERLYEGKRYPRERVYCDDVLDAGSTLLLNDPEHHPCLHFSHHLDISLGWRFYAGVPLTCRTGIVIGTICLMDVVPHDLEAEDMRLLETLALRLAHALEDAAESGALDGFPIDEAGIFSADLLPHFLDLAQRRAERRGEHVGLALVDRRALTTAELRGPGVLLTQGNGDLLTLLVVGSEAHVRERMSSAVSLPSVVV